MASTTTDIAPPTGPSSQAASQNAPQRGGYRGRGGRRGSGGGPGGAGEGRGGFHKSRGGRRQYHQNKPQDGTPEVEQPPESATSVLAGPAAPQATTVVKPDADDVASDKDSPVCFICADPVIYSAIALCTHTTCHICALRMRALYKNRACAHCRTEAEWVIFSKLEDKKFTDFQESDIVSANETLGIKFDDKAIEDDTNLLLHYNCPDKDCTRACRGWPDLHHHVKTAHERVLCDLCVRNKKVFTHEHTLFTTQELRKHERTGDDQPGSENQSGFKGHPECGFCRQRFYSSDELFTHCRDKHERCHICDRRNPTAPQQYYIDYKALAAHFAKDHFMCADEECVEKKFIVFENEVDLKAHQLEAHPNGLSKNAKRDARRIDLSQFAEPRSNDRGGNRRRRHDGRGQQEPEEAPIRTEQQMSRAELAYFRTLAVQSAQSTTTRTFGGQLTEPAYSARPPPPPPPPPQAARPAAQPVAATTSQAPPARPPARPAEPSPAASRAAFPPLARPSPPIAAASSSSSASSAARPPITSAGKGMSATDDIKRSRHNAVIDRAFTMLRQSDKKLETFKADISRYRQDYITASELVDQFWGLFDANAAELGTLIRELADLFEDDPKRQGLLKAWNDWKAINEDYPPFAGGASSASGSGSTQNSRVLKIKSSTSHSARSSTARQGAWGAAAVVPSPSSSTTFSSTPSSSSAPGPAPRSVNRQGPGAHAPTPWVTPSAPARPPASVSNPSVVVAGPSRKVGGKDEFPSLPTKPPPPPGWGPIKKKDPYAAYNGAPAPQAGAWGGGGGGSGGEQSAEPSESEGVGGSSSGGRKKKGKQKQVLFHVGL